MSESNSTAPAAPGKPQKPYPEFPLFPHASGRWCKKIKGRQVYFGPWSDPEGALAKYDREKEDLHAGRKPREVSTGVTIRDLVNAFLNHKRERVESGELSPRTFSDYRAAADMLVGHLGKSRLVADLGPDDFAPLRNKMSKTWGAIRVRDFVQRVRSIFKHGFDAGMVQTPVRFGPGFKGPSKKTMRLERAQKGLRMFEAAELRRILSAAGQPLKAMILLGANLGMGNADCGLLPRAAVNLETGWIDFPRPKTGIARRAPLWPETVEALREALAMRPEPKDPADAGLFFITYKRGRWHKAIADNPISKEMRKLLDSLGINGKRNFYVLRHTFRTVADESRDQAACDFLMGHARDDMASVYRERISDERLQAVVNHVRGWLFAAPDKGGEEE